MRWRILNKRRKAKLDGPTLKNSTLRRVALCNRFAAASEAPGLRVPGRGYYQTTFYHLKDRLMDKYGRPKGYALQEWTSYAYDYGEDYGTKDGATHRHILERVKLGRLTLHRPTGHFAYTNEVSEYYKHTEGFDLMAAACVERMSGKKHVTRNVPTKEQALAALAWLLRRYAALYDAPEKAAPRLRVKTGNHYDEYLNAPHRRDREHRAAERAAAILECHFCLKKKPDSELTNVGGHDICVGCAGRLMLRAIGGGPQSVRHAQVPF